MNKLISNKRLDFWIRNILAGVVIGFGGIVFLSSLQYSKITGSVLFTVGLFLILTRNYNLITGKICYARKDDILDMFYIWLGNIIGASLIGLIVLTCIPDLSIIANNTIENKLQSENIIQTILLGILCNIMIFIAVDGFKFNENNIGKYLSLFFGVTIFVLCGFEHCIADMFYLALSVNINFEKIIFILSVSIGNIIGGLMCGFLKRFLKQIKYQ